MKREWERKILLILSNGKATFPSKRYWWHDRNRLEFALFLQSSCLIDLHWIDHKNSIDNRINSNELFSFEFILNGTLPTRHKVLFLLLRHILDFLVASENERNLISVDSVLGGKKFEQCNLIYPEEKSDRIKWWYSKWKSFLLTSTKKKICPFEICRKESCHFSRNQSDTSTLVWNKSDQNTKKNKKKHARTRSSSFHAMFHGHFSFVIVWSELWIFEERK